MALRTNFRFSIAQKFVIYILLFSSFAALISTTIQLFFEYKRDVHVIEKTAEQIDSSHKSTITQAVWAYDAVILESQLQGIKSLPGVLYSSIHKGDEIIAEVGPRHLNEKFLSFKYDLLHYTKNKELQLGVLEVKISLSDVYDRLWDRVVLILFTQTIKTFFVSIFILFLFYFIVGRHLKVMASFAGSIQLDNLDQELVLNRKGVENNKVDELGLVESALNRMRLKLLDEMKNVQQAQEDLKKSEERFQLAMQFANDGLFDWNLKTNEIYYSPVWKSLLGYKDDEIKNDFSEWVRLTKPDDVKASLTMLDEVLDGKRERFEKELQMRHKDGHWVDILSRGNVIFDDEGKGIRIVGTHVDISQRKKMENDLIQSHKMEAIGTLAGGIAHDFNNILSAIMGYTELALEDAKTDTNQKDYLQEVFTASKRAKDLVWQILTFARQAHEPTKPIQVVPIVNEVLKFIRSSIPTTIEIKQHLNSESLINGNPTQIHQIIMNLCTNASHAMEKTGGNLVIELKDVMIDNTSVRSENSLKPGVYIEIKVSDTGVGIPQDVIGSIFQPYFTTKSTGDGTGMGLAVVQGIVENSGGKITVESEVGIGSSFSVLLPITGKRKAEDKHLQEDLPTGTERVLFVDDEASIANMGARNLERLGYSVKAHTSSAEALELFRTQPDEFDLVITDMTMPNMTGDVLATELMTIRPEIPIILCTGFSKKISDETAKEIGIKAFAYKPIARADLAKTVRKVLDENKGPGHA